MLDKYIKDITPRYSNSGVIKKDAHEYVSTARE